MKYFKTSLKVFLTFRPDVMSFLFPSFVKEKEMKVYKITLPCLCLYVGLSITPWLTRSPRCVSVYPLVILLYFSILLHSFYT
jgi:hypothetical protein